MENYFIAKVISIPSFNLINMNRKEMKIDITLMANIDIIALNDTCTDCKNNL